MYRPQTPTGSERVRLYSGRPDVGHRGAMDGAPQCVADSVRERRPEANKWFDFSYGDVLVCGGVLRGPSAVSWLVTELARAGFDPVDLVIPDGTDVVLRFHAVRRNRPIFQAPGFDHPEYFTRALNEYWDLQPLLRVRHAQYRVRALHG